MKKLLEDYMKAKRAEKEANEIRLSFEQKIVETLLPQMTKTSQTFNLDEFKVEIKRNFVYSTKGDVPEGVDIWKTVVDQTKLKRCADEDWVQLKAENKPTVSVSKCF